VRTVANTSTTGCDTKTAAYRQRFVWESCACVPQETRSPRAGASVCCSLRWGSAYEQDAACLVGRLLSVGTGRFAAAHVVALVVATVPIFMQSLLSMLMVKALWRMVSVLVNKFVNSVSQLCKIHCLCSCNSMLAQHSSFQKQEI